MVLPLVGLVAGALLGGGAVHFAHRQRSRASLASRSRARHPSPGAGLCPPAPGSVPDPDEESSAALRAALTALTAFGHGEPGAALARAATLLQGASPALVRDPEWRAQTLESLAALRLVHAPLTRAMARARTVLASRGVSSEPIIARFRRIQRDGETLVEQLERGDAPDAGKAILIGQAIQRLDLMLAAARRLLRASFRCHVMSALGTLMLMKQPLFIEHDVLDHTLVTRSPWGALVASMDAQRLMFEVFDDLISNAVHAMRGCAVRRLTVTAEREGPLIVVRLADTGCGVDPSLGPILFERGVTTRGSGGGLGLFMAHQALREFGGRIRVERSAPGEGTTFVVEVPAAPREPSEIPSGAAPLHPERARDQGQPAQ